MLQRIHTCRDRLISQVTALEFFRNALQEEQTVFETQQGEPPSDSKQSAGLYALTQIARTLEKLFLQLCLRQQFLAHAAQVISHGLSHIPSPSKLLKVDCHQIKLWPTLKIRCTVLLWCKRRDSCIVSLMERTAS